MERLFRSLKSEQVAATGYTTLNEAQRDISYYLMTRYNRLRAYCSSALNSSAWD
jgi:putative transposase